MGYLTRVFTEQGVSKDGGESLVDTLRRRALESIVSLGSGTQREHADRKTLGSAKADSPTS